MKYIQLGTGLKLPAEDFIERATALIAKRGKGKSGGVKVIEEALLEAKLPFVVFDPVGIHWGLKSTFDGKKASGHEVLVFGGEHGDLPFDRKAGRTVARSIAESGASLVVDFKSVPHAAYREFVADFADELCNVNQHPRLLIFEEASRLMPQRVRPDQTACLDAVQRLVLEGRNAALGCIVVSQRAATLNKDVLTQMDNLIVLGITGPQDRKAVREWIEQNADDESVLKFLDELASLQPREAWFWSPDMGIFQKFRFKDFTTFHPDRTHLRRLGLLQVKAVQTDVAGLVERLGSEMKTLAEKAKAEDPAALRAEVHRLKELTSRSPAIKEVVKSLREEVPILTKEDRKYLQECGERLVNDQIRIRVAAIVEAMEKGPLGPGKRLTELRVSQMDAIAKRIERILGTAAKAAGSAVQFNQQAKAVTQVTASAPRAPHPTYVRAKQYDGGEAGAPNPKKCERAILTVLAQLRDGCDFGKLTLLSGYRNSGGFRNALGNLRKWGWIEGDNGGTMRITAVGDVGLGPYEALPTGKALHDYWLSHSSLKACERAILSVLLDAHPDSLSFESIMEKTGYENSGGFRNALGNLRKAGLMVGKNSDVMHAADNLFEGATA